MAAESAEPGSTGATKRSFWVSVGSALGIRGPVLVLALRTGRARVTFARLQATGFSSNSAPVLQIQPLCCELCSDSLIEYGL